MANSLEYRKFKKGEFGYYLDGKLIPSNSNDDYLKMIGLDRFMMYQLLTPAEINFFEKSIYTGDFDLKPDLPVDEKVFRTLFLEWIFKVPLHEQFRFLRIRKLVFKNIIFKNYYDLDSSEGVRESIKKTIKERENSLEIINNNIEVDIEFYGCTFHGGIDFENSTFNNLSFFDCTIDAPVGNRTFVGTQSHIKGNLLIERLDDPFKTSIGKRYRSDFCDSIDFSHSRIEKELRLHNLRFVGHQWKPEPDDDNQPSLYFHNSSINYINIYNVECFESPLNFSLAFSKNTFIHDSTFFNNSNVESTASFNGFKGEVFIIRKSKIFGFLELPYMQIDKFLEISNSTLMAYDYFKPGDSRNKSEVTLNMSHSNCPVIKLNDQFVSLGTLDLSAINTNKLWLNDSLIIGYGNKEEIGKSSQFALVLERAKISSYIGFNRLFLKDKNINGVPVLEEKVDKDLVEKQFNAIQEHKKLSNIPLNENEKEFVEYLSGWFEIAQRSLKTLIDNVNLSAYKESNSSAIIYGANFKGMQVTGQFDCRGAYFYSPINEIKKDATHDNLRKKLIAYLAWFISKGELKRDIEYNGIAAMDMSHLQVVGDLFLNEGLGTKDGISTLSKIPLAFKAEGVVDLRFANLDKFFLIPHLNTIAGNVWYINGLTYSGIFNEIPEQKFSERIYNWLMNFSLKKMINSFLEKNVKAFPLFTLRLTDFSPNKIRKFFSEFSFNKLKQYVSHYKNNTCNWFKLRYKTLINRLYNYNSVRLEHLNWFTPLLDVNHRRQPFEELAFFFNRIGNDSKAKKIIVKGRYRTTIILERIFYYIINFFTGLGMPAYKSLIALICIYLIGVYGFSYTYDHGGFNYVLAGKNTDDECRECMTAFSSWEYSFLNMWPVKIVDSQQFIPTDTYIPFSFRGEEYKPFSTRSYRIIHKVFSTIFLALFIIGITKITKQEHHPSNT